MQAKAVLLKEQLVLTAKMHTMEKHAASVQASEREAKQKLEALMAEREAKIQSAATDLSQANKREQ